MLSSVTSTARPAARAASAQPSRSRAASTRGAGYLRIRPLPRGHAGSCTGRGSPGNVQRPQAPSSRGDGEAVMILCLLSGVVPWIQAHRLMKQLDVDQLGQQRAKTWEFLFLFCFEVLFLKYRNGMRLRTFFSSSFSKENKQ